MASSGRFCAGVGSAEMIWFGSGLSMVVVGEIKPLTDIPPSLACDDEAGEGWPAGELPDALRDMCAVPGFCVPRFDGDMEEAVGPGVGSSAYPAVFFVSIDADTDSDTNVNLCDGSSPASAGSVADPVASKLHRTPAWTHRVHEGLTRSHRLLKWRHLSQVLTSRIWGITLGMVARWKDHAAESKRNIMNDLVCLRSRKRSAAKAENLAVQHLRELGCPRRCKLTAPVPKHRVVEGSRAKPKGTLTRADALPTGRAQNVYWILMRLNPSRRRGSVNKARRDCDVCSGPGLHLLEGGK
jgi:hypothetical protein